MFRRMLSWKCGGAKLEGEYDNRVVVVGAVRAVEILKETTFVNSNTHESRHFVRTSECLECRKFKKN